MADPAAKQFLLMRARFKNNTQSEWTFSGSSAQIDQIERGIRSSDRTIEFVDNKTEGLFNFALINIDEVYFVQFTRGKTLEDAQSEMERLMPKEVKAT